MYFKQEGAVSTLSGRLLKFVDQFPYIGKNISSTESGVNIRLAKAWIATERPLTKWKSNLSNKIKQNFFQAVVVSVLLYGCTTWNLKKKTRWELHKNATWSFEQILGAAPYKTTVVIHLPPISQIK